ncbi:hypothetical protein [Kribbella sp. CA-294648]|uniref:hypothetical protein n=1 Tax=Kribbella sp. CA-294648 TaxID=3239948 RepID=UPI003D8D5215
MGVVLPGSGSGRSWGVAFTKAALRLIGGADLADAIMDLTGLSRKRVNQLVAKAGRELEVNADHEFAQVDESTTYLAAEALAVEAFASTTRSLRPQSGQQAIMVKALMGPDELAALVTDALHPGRTDAWAPDELAYFHALVRRIAELICAWYRDEPSARASASVAAIGQLLRNDADQLAALGDLQDKLTELESGPVGPTDAKPDACAVIAIEIAPEHANLHFVRRCAQWLRWVLESQGFQVRTGPPSGLADELLIIAGAASGPVSSLIAGSEDRPAGSIQVSFDTDGTMHLGGQFTDSAEASRQLCATVELRMRSRARSSGEKIGYDDATTLPRLQRLSRQAIRDAAAVGHRTYDAPGEGDGLYVNRDLEERVLDEFTRTDLVVVSGVAGSGKTSLLWGLTQRLIANPTRTDVYFLKASYLMAEEGNPPVVNGAELADAIRSRSLEKESFVLVDTADLLVSDERTLVSLLELIDAVRSVGGQVVISARPDEALTITAGGDPPLRLGPFSTFSPAQDKESEFARAVRAHATAYSSAPGQTSGLAQQLLSAAIRGTPLGGLAQLPLSLRMLFELYAPGLVPAEVSGTSLFERYWEHRVVADRRTGHALPAEGAPARNLSNACHALAAEMLRAGLPEVRPRLGPAVGHLPHATAEDITLLCGRGIGSVTRDGAFHFFHQAFFEFAAARLLVEYRGGLQMLLSRADARPDDYFLSPVVEQAWVLAWLRPDRMQEASELSLQHLAQTRQDLVRRVLRVLAQISVPDKVAERMRAMFPDLDLDLVKEYFRLLPRPGTRWQGSDSDLLVQVHSRDGGAARHAVIDVLLRLSFADPTSARVAIDHIADASPRPLLDDSALDYAGLRTLLAVLRQQDCSWLLDLFDRSEVGVSVATATPILARVFSILDGSQGSDATAAARWADSVSTRSAESSALVHALALLHMAAMQPVDGSRHAEELLATVRAALDAIEGGDTPSLTAAASAWAGIDTLSRTAPDDVVLELLQDLEGHTDPRLHELFHHGWFVRALNESAIVRSHFARVLADGLPANRRSPGGPPQRWADTLRRTLLRPDVEAPTLAAVLGSAIDHLAGRVPAETAWLEPDYLLWLLLPATNAGELSATRVIEQLHSGGLEIQQRDEHFAVQQAQSLTDDGPGTPLVLRFLAERRGYVELLQLIQRVPGLVWPESIQETVSAGLLRDAATGEIPARARAARLLLSATSNGTLPYPGWADLEPLRSGKHLRVKVPMSALFTNGLLAGHYPPQAVVDRLNEWVAAHPADRDLRHNLVRTLAAAGNSETVARAVDLAFIRPVDAGVVIDLAGYLNRDTRLAAFLPAQDTVQLLIDVGRRLGAPDVPGRSKSDVPGTWKEMMGRVLNRASNAELVVAVNSVPGLDPTFATHLLAKMPARHSPSLEAALKQLRGNENLATPIIRTVTQKLGTTRSSATPEWPELSQELLKLKDAQSRIDRLS